jgi:energy-coupling factor transport system ATP-binding protein
MDKGSIVVDAPPRQAFADLSLWRNLGVSVPQVIQLARALPDIFQDSTPLSVDEMYTALCETDYARALRLRNEALRTASTDEMPAAFSSARGVLTWESVGLAYESKRVLKDINMKILPGEWVAIIGSNGSGKTSLASLAMGFQRPTEGLVRYKEKVVKAGQISRQSASIAYLFQAADTMLFESTVEREFLFGVKHGRKQQKDLAFSLEQLLKTVDLTDYRQANPFHLSFGQRKRLAIGALLTRNPELLILDEPTTGQDEGHAAAFLQFLEQLREQEQLTYVMITHDMRAVARYASRVIVLNDGGVYLDDIPERVFARVDDLAQCGILPPSIAQLHARLCDGQAQRVDLSVPAFLQSLQPVEVIS